MAQVKVQVKAIIAKAVPLSIHLFLPEGGFFMPECTRLIVEDGRVEVRSS